MGIENAFIVQAPIERVWSYLLDVEKVAPCLPGAQLTDVIDDRSWKGKTSIKTRPGKSVVFRISRDRGTGR